MYKIDRRGAGGESKNRILGQSPCMIDHVKIVVVIF